MFELEEYNRNISDEKLLEDLKKVSKTLEKDSVTIAEYEQYGKYNHHTLQNRFGSWTDALEKAGLRINRKVNITEKELFKNIENVWIKLGRQPRYSEIKKPLSAFSTKPYESRFGSWMKALEQFVVFINADDSEEDVEEKKDEIIKQESKQQIVHKTKREISDRLRFKILMRDGFTCKKCGRSPMKELGVELHVDHILPWSKGGETIPENLETKCRECNLGKGNAFNV